MNIIELTEMNISQYKGYVSADASKLLFERYNEIARANEVYRTTFVLPAKDSKDEKTVLKEMGFKVRLTEGDLVTCDLSEVRKLDLVSKVKPGDSIRALRTASQRGFTNAIRRLAMGEHAGVYRDLAFLPSLKDRISDICNAINEREAEYSRMEKEGTEKEKKIARHMKDNKFRAIKYQYEIYKKWDEANKKIPEDQIQREACLSSPI